MQEHLVIDAVALSAFAEILTSAESYGLFGVANTFVDNPAVDNTTVETIPATIADIFFS